MEAVVPAECIGVTDLIAGRAIRAVYQPIVDLESGETVAFEALARGPADHPLERPDALFADAAAQGCVRELDRACQRAALDGALAAGLAAPSTLFVNVEPEWAGSALLHRVSDREPRSSVAELPVVVEITERALTANPVELLHMVDRVRARGWGIAIDDVGADPASLAILPLLRPDVVKLDLRLVQDQPNDAIARIFNAVHAERERTGTTILAEGIETEQHRDTARSFGATLGQGWLLGRPRPLPDELPTLRSGAAAVRLLDHSAAATNRSAFDIAAQHRVSRVAGKHLLIEISKQFESQAAQIGEAALIVSTLQHAKFFTPATRDRYRALADTAAFIGLVGEDLPTVPLAGVRGGQLSPADPLLHEWDVAVLGPHFAGSLVARDLGDSGPDRDRRFEFIVTHDRDLTVSIAQSLIARIAPRGSLTAMP